MDHLVFTVLAADKPGRVDCIAQCILQHEGNWMDSRLSRMAGQFAGIVRVAVAKERSPALVASLQALASQGIEVTLVEGRSESASAWKPVTMELVGNDRPGIVSDITSLLAEHEVSFERLVTDVRPAPMSSEPLFHADAVLALPLALPVEKLQELLQALANDMMVDLVLRTEQ